MNNPFDELTKSLAQAVTRRAALKKFGVGLAGMALACFGLTNKAEAAGKKRCVSNADCNGNTCCNTFCCPGGKPICCFGLRCARYASDCW
jgi:hypothetical protein